MKKFRIALTCIVTAILLCFCMTAVGCGKKYEGTYKFKSMSMNMDGFDMSISAGMEMGGIILTEDLLVIEIKGDGTFTMVVDATFAGGETQSLEGTWESDGDELTLTATNADGEVEDQLFIYDDGEISFSGEMDGISVEYVLEKQ